MKNWASALATPVRRVGENVAMSLTKPQIDFLKRLAMRPRGEVVLAHSHQPERWIDLEQVGYVTAKRATKEGDLSMLFNITDAGRRVLAEQRP
jgi:hypothetical protein